MGGAVLHRHILPNLGQIVRLLVIAVFVSLLAGCAVNRVSAYDKDSVARIADLSKNSLSIYQSLLDTESDKRADAIRGSLAARWADVETQIRVHGLIEQSRKQNRESMAIAIQMLDFWEKAKAKYIVGEIDVLKDFVLKADRSSLERILGAAMQAEEAKKLGDPSSK